MKKIFLKIQSWRIVFLSSVIGIATLIAAIWFLEFVHPPGGQPLMEYITYQTGFIILAFLLSVLITWVVWTTSLVYVERQQLRILLANAERRMAASSSRFADAFQICHQFLQAEDENELIKHVLSACLSLGVAGATFVPLDIRGKPMQAQSVGEMPAPAFDAWVEYLASPAVRHRCGYCEHLQSHAGSDCPLLKENISPIVDVETVLCYPLRRGDRDLGMLNIYLRKLQTLGDEERILLQVMLDELALVMDSVRIRSQELMALHQIQQAFPHKGQKELLDELLKRTVHTFQADFGILKVYSGTEESVRLFCEQLYVQNKTFVDGVMQNVIETGELMIVGALSGEEEYNLGNCSLMAVPLPLNDTSMRGGLLIANSTGPDFSRRALPVFQVLAEQAAFLLQRSHQLAEVRFETIREERSRLAFEIHDGLAQTISFLKLQIAQLQNAWHRGDHTRLENGFQICYRTLSEAYQDVRESIDGLRLMDRQGDLQNWLLKLCSEFQTNFDIPIQLDLQEVDALPIEVQAQIIRIVHEGLSNIRRHAHASQVWISAGENQEGWQLQIRDNGQGFTPDEVQPYSHHGLQGMRERTEKMGADFQVISRSMEGTVISICIPTVALQEMKE